MKILDVIFNYQNNVVSLFFEQKDFENALQKLVNLYNADEELEWIFLWYEEPKKSTFSFLWTKYDCIDLWFDNEVDFWESSYNNIKYFIKNWMEINEDNKIPFTY